MWTNSKTSKVALLTTAILLLGAIASEAADKRLEKGAFGVKAGWISAVDFTLHWKVPQRLSVDHTTKIGLAAGVFYDIPIGRRFMLSPAVDLLDINLRDDRQWMIDVSLGLKRVLHLRGSSVAVKPAIAIGYAYLAEFEPLKATEYMTWKVLVETVFLVNSRYSYLLEFSVTGTNNGGNNDVDVATNPVVGLRLGVAY